MRLFRIRPDGNHAFLRDVENVQHAMDWIEKRYPEIPYSLRDEDGQWRDNVNLTKTGDSTFTLDFDIMVDDNEEDVIQYSFIVI